MLSIVIVSQVMQSSASPVCLLRLILDLTPWSFRRGQDRYYEALEELETSALFVNDNFKISGIFFIKFFFLCRSHVERIF